MAKKKYCIVILKGYDMLASYFVNIENNGFWYNDNKKIAMKFETFDAAVAMYNRIAERCEKLNWSHAIIEA